MATETGATDKKNICSDKTKLVPESFGLKNSNEATLKRLKETTVK